MKRFAWMLALTVAAGAMAPSAALAYVRSVKVVNTSANCAWITVYRDDMGWEILGGDNRPREMAPGGSRTFTMANQAIKVLAETMHSAKCDTSHGPALDKVFHGSIQMVSHPVATLTGSSKDGFALNIR
jgi:hypothetical protein